MGADVLEESNTKETAGDVAERCNANKEIIQILRASEGNSSTIISPPPGLILGFYFRRLKLAIKGKSKICLHKFL